MVMKAATVNLNDGDLLAVAHWSQQFKQRVGQHGDVASLEGASASPAERAAYGPSLATFQLGETGTGDHLANAATSAGASAAYVETLRRFIGEEQEHARLLALVLETMDHPLRTTHWTDSIFVHLRRLKSLRTEVLVLLIAEVIAVGYYSALRDGVDDPQLSAVFGRIHDDEIVHIAFHGETLRPWIDGWSPPLRTTVRLVWNTLVVGASVVVALDHRKALSQAGKSFGQMVRQVSEVRSGLDTHLFA